MPREAEASGVEALTHRLQTVVGMPVAHPLMEILGLEAPFRRGLELLGLWTMPLFPR